MLRHHLGLRTVKTGLAVALSLLFATVRHSPAPIFAGIGAIVAMSRTLEDTVRAALTELAGTICGVIIACVMLAVIPPHLFPGSVFVLGGVGIILVILCCNAFHLNFAIPLSCIVFASIWVMDPTENSLLYGLNRLTDTAIGLLTALVINVGIRPYNNQNRISQMLTDIQKLFPGYLETRVLHGQYPNLSKLWHELSVLEKELDIFEKQPPPSLRHRKVLREARRQDTAYMRGCQQLLSQMAQELSAMCSMTSSPHADAHNYKRLQKLGLCVDHADEPCKYGEADQIVLNFHLKNLLDANDFLTDMNSVSG